MGGNPKVVIFVPPELRLGSEAPWRPTTSSTVALPEGFLEEALSLEQGMFQPYIILLHRYVCWGQDNTAVKTEVSGSDTISGDKREPAGAPTLHLGSQTKERTEDGQERDEKPMEGLGQNSAEVIITTAGEFVRLGDKDLNDSLETRQSPQTATRIEITSAFELATLLANLDQSEHFSIEDGIKLENESGRPYSSFHLIEAFSVVMKYERLKPLTLLASEPGVYLCVSSERREKEHITQRLGLNLTLPSLLLALLWLSFCALLSIL
ncbi:hypothetical protein MJT46_018238 [Ovis ammon polii x Ovis aries]|nr:hypothetical protein MJT46_018238 [Ovis ammon polii x Ovis aries]